MRRRRASGLSFYEKQSKINARIVKEVLLWLLYTVVALLMAVVVVESFGYRVSVIGASMEPLLVNGQDVLVNRVIYRIANISRGDVIVFYPGGNTSTHPYVKRVVAVPGDTVQIVDGELLINGFPDPTNEDYDKIEDAGIAAEPVTLGDDEYFVLGDSRNNSEDSRSAGIGAVSAGAVIGKAWLSLPEGELGLGLVR
ncbi:MAG: signal peptidase I [Eubacteriales bacterium]|nr:signal peptidase I [Eubacteriales bacterium]